MAERIIDTPIIHEVEQSFLDYSLSVITDRAIPSAEDGLKPAARRLLWDMFDKGFTNDKKFVKCAQPVGDTMARYHPHGDSSIYGALAWLSQPWSMRYPLIDFHGNNGSRDGDEPAAYRYTECKLSKAGEEMLADIKKNTCNWTLAYTDEEYEPEYLPGLIPNLLVNGTSGIAVAMACSFAPHNLREILEAAKYSLNNNCTVDDLLKFVTGPDFPTGGLVINKDELATAYKTGKGRARIRGEYTIESSKSGDLIVFTSIPYKVSKNDLIQEIDKLCEDGTINGVTSIRDETNIEGVRFVIELNKETSAQTVLHKLFKHTNLETTYSFNQVALVDKQPRLLNLKQLIDIYTEHQGLVLIKKTEYDLSKAQARAHILEGILKALANIDDIIKVIKTSESAAVAKKSLMAQYQFSEEQAKAILDIKLSRLSHLENEDIQKEYDYKIKEIERLGEILRDPKPELIKIFDRLIATYGDSRRTTITQINETKEEKEIEFVEPEKCVVIMTESGLIKRVPSTSFKTQKRNGKGVKTQDDVTAAVIRTNTVDSLMIFTNKGKMYRLLVNDIPVGTNISTGQSIRALIAMDGDEIPTTIYSIYRDTDAKYVLFVTKNGLVKKTSLDEYIKTKKKTGIAAINIKEDDALAAVTLVKDEDIILLTKLGMGIRIKATDISTSGRTTMGVKGITLGKGDSVVSCLAIHDINDKLAIFASSGLAKKINLNELPAQSRGGKGLIVYKVSPTTGNIACGSLVSNDDMVLVCGDLTSICISASEIPELSRSGIGNIVLKNNKILSVSKV